LQKTGERSYGTDVWSKNTPELVVEQRYWIEDVVMMPAVDKLRKENRQRGDSLYRLNSYHNDHGRGMDLYKVGATLGCGTPALMTDGKLNYPYCFKDCEILDNGPMRMKVHLTYNPARIGTETAIVEHRYIELDKGSNFNRVDVRYDGLPQSVDLASGIVLHSEYEDNVELSREYVLYADPTDHPEVHQSQIYVATLFPDGVDESVVLKGAQPHGVGIVRPYRGQPYTYYFGSAWSLYDVPTFAHWKLLADEYLLRLKHPLQIQ
jgi:hypothetical protein